MRRIVRWSSALALAAVAALGPAAPASAEVKADTGNIEVFLGWYVPEDDLHGENLDDVTYGVRGGFSFTKSFMLQFGLQSFSTDVDAALSDVDIDQVMFDVSLGWVVNPEDKAVFMLYGGPGWSETDYDLVVPGLKDESDSSLSAHVGVAGLIQIGNRFYLRPDGRFRWIDGDHVSGDRNDWEITLGFGWALGDVSK